MSLAWRTSIVRQLQERDTQQKLPFSELVSALNSSHSKLSAISKQNAAFERDLSKATGEISDLKRELNVLQSGPVNSKKLAELEEKIAQLKEENTELYKTRGTNAQRLYELSEAARSKDEVLKKREEDLNKVTEAFSAANTRIETLTHQVAEKDVTIQLLRDELTASQLECVKMDEKLKNLEDENKSLLNRWLKKMNEEAEKLNEANQFIKSVTEIKTAPKKQEEEPGSARKLSPAIGFSFENLLRRASHEQPEPEPPILKPSAPTAVIPTTIKRTVNAHDAEVTCVQSSRSSLAFATGSTDSRIKIFDSITGVLRQTFSGATQSIMSLDFSANDELILAASNDNTARVWSTSTGRVKHTLTGHLGKVFSAKFSEDDHKIVSGSHDRTIKLWDLQKSYCIRTIFCVSSCNDCSFSDATGKTVVSGHLDNAVRLWDCSTGDLLRELTDIHVGQVTSVSMSRDGNYVLSASRDNTLRLIDVRSFEVVHKFSAEGYKSVANHSRVCFSPDSQFIAAGSSDGSVYVWSAVNGKLQSTLKGNSRAPIVSVAWHSGGSLVFAAENTRNVCVWGQEIE